MDVPICGDDIHNTTTLYLKQSVRIDNNSVFAPVQSHSETETDVKPIMTQNIVNFDSPNSTTPETTQRMNIPQFFYYNDTLFFEFFESQFILKDISDSKTKLNLLLSSANQCQLELLQEIISNICANFDDPCDKIKAQLLKRYVRPYFQR